MPCSDKDTGLYRYIHEALKQQEPGDDRRLYPRKEFVCQQLIAPYNGQRLPVQHEFRHVWCLDISSQGFAFESDTSIMEPLVVAALGAAPFTFIVARIVRIEVREGRETGAYVVGCRFVQRLFDANGERPTIHA